MKYKRFGNSFIQSSIIGVGCWQLGGELIIGGQPQSYGKIDEKEAKDAIDCALDLGINFFDTADFYGLGKSEYLLGEALKNKRNKAIICTKGGYVPDGLRGSLTDGSYENIIASCNRSLKRLQTDYIDVYLLHFLPQEKDKMDLFRATDRLKKEGKIKLFGISAAQNIEKGLEFVLGIDVLEGYYNMLLRDVENSDESIKQVAFIAASPLSTGLLGGAEARVFDNSDVRKKWEGSQNEWYKKQMERVEKLRAISGQFEIPMKNLALAYVLSNDAVSVTIPGMKNRKQVEELVESLKFVPLDTEIIKRIREI